MPLRVTCKQFSLQCLNTSGTDLFCKMKLNVFRHIQFKTPPNLRRRNFKKSSKIFQIRKALPNPNLISIHVLFKGKAMENDLLKTEARISFHGNEENQRYETRSDCSICISLGICALQPTAALCNWRLPEIDVKSAFPQTGHASKDSYLVPTRERNVRYKVLWLLLIAAYSLVDANLKFQVQVEKSTHRSWYCASCFNRTSVLVSMQPPFDSNFGQNCGRHVTWRPFFNYWPACQGH